MEELYEKYVKVRKDIVEYNAPVRSSCEKYGISTTYYYNQLRKEEKQQEDSTERDIFRNNESKNNKTRGEGVEAKRELVDKVNAHAKANNISKKMACDDLSIDYFRYRNASYYVSCYDKGKPYKRVQEKRSTKKSTKKPSRPKSIKLEVPSKEEVTEPTPELPKKVTTVVEKKSPSKNKKVAVVITDVENLSDILSGLN